MTLQLVPPVARRLITCWPAAVSTRAESFSLRRGIFGSPQTAVVPRPRPAASTRDGARPRGRRPESRDAAGPAPGGAVAGSRRRLSPATCTGSAPTASRRRGVNSSRQASGPPHAAVCATGSFRSVLRASAWGWRVATRSSTSRFLRCVARLSRSPMFSAVRCAASIVIVVSVTSPEERRSSTIGNRRTTRAASMRRYAADSDRRSTSIAYVKSDA